MSRKVPTPPPSPATEYVIDYDAITYGDVKRIREIIASAMDSNADKTQQMAMMDEIELIVLKYVTAGTSADDVPHIIVQRATTAVIERLSYRKSLGK